MAIPRFKKIPTSKVWSSPPSIFPRHEFPAYLKSPPIIPCLLGGNYAGKRNPFAEKISLLKMQSFRLRTVFKPPLSPMGLFLSSIIVELISHAIFFL